jgi:hypothetical protein
VVTLPAETLQYGFGSHEARRFATVGPITTLIRSDKGSSRTFIDVMIGVVEQLAGFVEVEDRRFVVAKRVWIFKDPFLPLCFEPRRYLHRTYGQQSPLAALFLFERSEPRQPVEVRFRRTPQGSGAVSFARKQLPGHRERFAGCSDEGGIELALLDSAEQVVVESIANEVVNFVIAPIDDFRLGS